VGTSTLGPLTTPGIFATNKRYRIRFGAWSDCVGWGESSWYLQYSTALKKVEMIAATPSVQALRPPVDRGKALLRS
jgi:hypothetical protein